MILNIITALQLILVAISILLVLYILMIKGDNGKSSYLMLLMNLCLLWMILI